MRRLFAQRFACSGRSAIVFVALCGGLDAAPEIRVTPSSLDFGRQDVGAGPTIRRSIVIENIGDAVLDFESIALTGDPGAGFAFATPPDTAGLTSVTFAPPVFYSTGNRADYATLADFDRDGDLDAAVLDSSDRVAILRGNGDGTFAPAEFFDAAGQPRHIASADLDNDGDTDLAFSNQRLGEVAIMLGNGDGTFAPRVGYPVGTNPAGLTISDLDNDGAMDIVVANQVSKDLSILLGNGDGTFTPSHTRRVESSTGIVVHGDFNLDSLTDLAVLNLLEDSITLLTGLGDGAFAAPVATLTTGDGPVSLLAKDLDGDGFDDLVSCNRSSHDLSIFFGLGSGAFGAPVVHPVSSAPQEVIAVDLNADGPLDLVVLTGPPDRISLLLGNGDKTFESALDYAWDFSLSSWLHGGDLDNDCDTDLFVGGGVVLLREDSRRQIDLVFDPSTLGAKSAQLRIESNDPQNPVVHLTLAGNGAAAPEIEVLDKGVPLTHDEGVVDFGIIAERGVAPRRTLTLRNIGSVPLAAGPISLPDGFTLVEGLDALVLPMQEDTFTVEFSTPLTGPGSGRARIAGNDPDENPFEFTLAGLKDPDPPVLEVSQPVHGGDWQPRVLRFVATATDPHPGSGIRGVYVREQGGEWIEAPYLVEFGFWRAEFEASAPGPLLLEAYAEDHAGHRSPLTSIWLVYHTDSKLSNIVRYLLGYHSDTRSLDENQDGTIDMADFITRQSVLR